MNWMFDELTKRGWITAVIRTNSARTAMMPVSLTRKTRSVSRRDPISGGAPDGSRGRARVVLTVPPGSLLRLLRVRHSVPSGSLLRPLRVRRSVPPGSLLRPLRVRRSVPPGSLLRPLRVRRSLCLLLKLAGRRRHDLFFRRVRAGVLADQPALAHHQDPVADAEYLRQLRGDHQDRDSVSREFRKQPVHLGLCGDVDAA